MPLNMSEFGLNIIRFISNHYGSVFLFRAGPFISTCMLENKVIVTPTLPKGKKGWRPKTVVADSTTNIKKYPKLEQKNYEKKEGRRGKRKRERRGHKN